MKILLASKSPRRQELLTQIGIQFELIDIEVDEQARPAEKPDQLVTRLSQEKAEAGWIIHNDMPLLAADTIVAIGENILGKPQNVEDARCMLMLLSGKVHHVYTSVTIIDIHGVARSILSCNKVTFRVIDEEEILPYWQSGEPIDKAGAYAIQGFGAVFVESITGSYSGIMGLPLFETAKLLNERVKL